MARASPRQTQHLNDMRPDRMMARLCRVLVLLLGLALPQAILAATKPPEGSQKLMLEVFINGDPTNLIAEFHRRPDGRFLSKRSELREIGVAVPKGNDQDLIELETIPGFGLRYDEPAQKLHVSLTPEMRLAKEYAANEPVGHVTQEKIGISSDFGQVLNYNLYGTSTRGYTQSTKLFNTGSVTLDHRAFSPLGVLQNTAIAGTTLAKKGILRLESSFVYAHPETMTLVTAATPCAPRVRCEPPRPNSGRPCATGTGSTSASASACTPGRRSWATSAPTSGWNTPRLATR